MTSHYICYHLYRWADFSSDRQCCTISNHQLLPTNSPRCILSMLFLALLVISSAFWYGNNATSNSLNGNSSLLSIVDAPVLISSTDIAKRIPDPNDLKKILFEASCQGVGLNKAIQDLIEATNTNQPPPGPPFDPSLFQEYGAIATWRSPIIKSPEPNQNQGCGDLGYVVNVLQQRGNIPYDNTYYAWNGRVSQAHTRMENFPYSFPTVST